MIFRLLIAGLALVASTAMGQPSYWFQQFQKQGNAQLAQQYFFHAGQGVTITYTNPYVYINASGTNYVISVATNATYAQYATNWLGSNAFYVLLTGQITNYIPGSNVTFTATGPHTYRIDATGGGSVTTGLTTNICVVFCNGATNMLNFTNGLLMAINGASGPSHAPSIILPGGGYLLQPSGSTILLP